MSDTNGQGGFVVLAGKGWIDLVSPTFPHQAPRVTRLTLSEARALAHEFFAAYERAEQYAVELGWELERFRDGRTPAEISSLGFCTVCGGVPLKIDEPRRGCAACDWRFTSAAPELEDRFCQQCGHRAPCSRGFLPPEFVFRCDDCKRGEL